MDTANALHKFISKVPNGPFSPAKGEATLTGVVYEISVKGLCSSIERVKSGGFLERNKI